MLVLFLALPGSAAAMYVEPDLVEIPIARLVKNLEGKIRKAKRPAISTRIALARLYAMGYARKSATAPALSPITLSLHDARVTRGSVDTGSPDSFFFKGENAPDFMVCGRRGMRSVSGKLTLLLTGPAPPRRGMAVPRVFPRRVKILKSTLRDRRLSRCLAKKMKGIGLRSDHKPFALRLVVSVRTRGGGLEAWYGHDDVTVPRQVRSGEVSAERASAAKRYLARALASYASLVRRAPENALVHLGQGWCREQSGDRAGAVDSYRKAHALAWKTEGKATGLGLGAVPIAAEAAGYLIPLLDPKKDAAELATLKQRQEKLESLPRPVTPILVPLGARHDLSDLVDPGAAVPFDLDGTGTRRRWGWTQANAGWLVYDRRGSGAIRSGLQMMGSAAFFAFFRDGYEALSALDDDGDGALRGSELQGLAIWRDANRNGISEPGEVRPVGAWGIVGLETSCVHGDAGMPFNARGVMMRDGSTRPSYDWSPEGR